MSRQGKCLRISFAVKNSVTKSSLERKLEEARKLYSAEMFALNAPDFSVSSREIRERVREGKKIRYMLPEEVGRYIRQHSLYLGQDGDIYDRTLKNDKKTTKKRTG